VTPAPPRLKPASRAKITARACSNDSAGADAARAVADGAPLELLDLARRDDDVAPRAELGVEPVDRLAASEHRLDDVTRRLQVALEDRREPNPFASAGDGRDIRDPDGLAGEYGHG
jgi:hypothetical protein